MSIRIITDSTCDLSPAQLQVLDIDFIPLSVYFGQEQYLDKVELSPEAFYQKLGQSKELPTTSQVNPDTFISHFQSELEKGHEIVGIFLSSRLSGTFQSAVIAKDQLQNDKIHLIDSMSASFGSALLLRHAARLRDEGKSAEEICQALDSIKDRLAVYGMVDTLKYLHKGGRLSASAAAVGTMLKLKPIVGIKDGAVVSVSKARGYKSAFRHLVHLLEREPADPQFGFACQYSGFGAGVDFRHFRSLQYRAIYCLRCRARYRHPYGSRLRRVCLCKSRRMKIKRTEFRPFFIS